MSMQEEKRSALASISALMPCWFLMTRSAEDTSLVGVQSQSCPLLTAPPYYRPPTPAPCVSGALSPGPLLGVHLQVDPIHPQHQLPDSLEEAEFIRGVQQ